MSLSFMIFLYIIQSSTKGLIVGTNFLQISFTYARNRSGSNTLPYGTPDVTMTSSDNCLPTLTLCERPQRNSLTHRTTLESTPDAAIFVSIRSHGTKSRAFENSITIASILAPSSRESATSWQTVTIWLTYEYPALNPRWPSYNHSLISQTCLRQLAMTCSIWLQTTEVELADV